MTVLLYYVVHYQYVSMIIQIGPTQDKKSIVYMRISNSTSTTITNINIIITMYH